MLEVRGLQCSRGSLRLFSEKSFKLTPGTLAWVRGRNGSGKSTLLRTLAGLSPWDDGEVRWRGRSIREQAGVFRRELVFIGHAVALKEELSAQENLRSLMHLGGQAVSSAETLAALAQVGLKAGVHRPVKYLSEGQKRRVQIARLHLSRDRPLWLLDEPMTALDAEGVGSLQALLAGFLHQAGMVVMTSHQEFALDSPRTLHLHLPT